MGYGGPTIPKIVENFISLHEKMLSVAKSRACKGHETLLPIRVIALPDSFQKIQVGSRVSEIRLLTQLE